MGQCWAGSESDKYRPSVYSAGWLFVTHTQFIPQVSPILPSKLLEQTGVFFPSLFLSDQHLFLVDECQVLKDGGGRLNLMCRHERCFLDASPLDFSTQSNTLLLKEAFSLVYELCLILSVAEALSHFFKNCILKSLLLSVSTPPLHPCLLIWLHSQPGCSSVQNGTSGMRWRSWE